MIISQGLTYPEDYCFQTNFQCQACHLEDLLVVLLEAHLEAFHLEVDFVEAFLQGVDRPYHLCQAACLLEVLLSWVGHHALVDLRLLLVVRLPCFNCVYPPLPAF